MPQATTDIEAGLTSKHLMGGEGLPEVATLTDAEQAGTEQAASDITTGTVPAVTSVPTTRGGLRFRERFARAAATKASSSSAAPVGSAASDPAASALFAEPLRLYSKPSDPDARSTRLGAATGGCVAGGILGMAVGGPVGALVGGVMGGVAGQAFAPRR